MILRNGRIQTRNLHTVIILLMVQALLLPVYGPWLNYQYAEWLPGHKHIFFGEIDHHHHSRHKSEPQNSGHKPKPPKVQSKAEILRHAIASLPDLDATRSMAMLSALDVIHMLLADQQHTLVFPFWEEELHRQGIVISPPERPPRATPALQAIA